jgi:hypothetical protein
MLLPTVVNPATYTSAVLFTAGPGLFFLQEVSAINTVTVKTKQFFNFIGIHLFAEVLG